jgi:hypothetical protein
MKKILAVAGIATVLLASAVPALAWDMRASRPQGGDTEQRRKQPPPEDTQRVSAPEIDVAAGSMGVAIIVGGLLLMAEGMRRRR